MPAVFLFLIETKLGRTIAITTAIVVGVLIGWVAFAKHYENIGYQKAIAAVAAQDRKALDHVNTALESVKACRSSGGTWSVPDGVCNH